MAVLLASNVHHYTGLSSDSKPTGVPVGSLFYEYDTRMTWITYDGTNWERNETWLLIG